MASVAEVVEVDAVDGADKAVADRVAVADKDVDVDVEVDKVEKVGVAHNEDKT